MLSLFEQVFVGRDEKRAPLKTPAWETKIFAGKIILKPWKFRKDSNAVERPNRYKFYSAAKKAFLET